MYLIFKHIHSSPMIKEYLVLTIIYIYEKLSISLVYNMKLRHLKSKVIISLFLQYNQDILRFCFSVLPFLIHLKL